MIRQELATRGASEIGTTAKRQWPLGTRFWVRFHGQDTSLASGSAHGANARLSGFVVGVDRTFASRWFAGAGAGYSTGDLTVDFLGDSADYSTPRGFGYVGISGSRWIVHGGASVARNAYDLRRSLAFAAMFPDSLGGGPIFGGIDRQATMRLTGLATEVWADAALVSHLGQFELRPSAGLRVARYGRNAAAESGADALSLASPEQSLVSRQATLGISASRPLAAWRERVGRLSAGADRRPTTTTCRCRTPLGASPSTAVVGAQRRHRRRRRNDAAEERAVVARLRREACPRRDASGDPVRAALLESRTTRTAWSWSTVMQSCEVHARKRSSCEGTCTFMRVDCRRKESLRSNDRSGAQPSR